MKRVNYNVIKLTRIRSFTNPVIFPSRFFVCLFMVHSLESKVFSEGFHFIRITLLRWSHTRRSATTIFRATILALFCNNVASCDARNILPFNSASSILEDSGTVSRVGRNGSESFKFVLYPIDRPWVSKDVLLKTKTKTVSGKGQETFSIRSAVFHHFD